MTNPQRRSLIAMAGLGLPGLSGLSGLLGLSGLAPRSAHAQTEAIKPVKIIVPFSPGGGIDILGRAVGQKLNEQWNVAVVVDNRPGASGNIGTELVARAPADGYTLLVAPLTSYAMNAQLYPATVGFQLDRDFTGVSLLGYLPVVLVVNDALPARTTAELVRQAKAKPGSLSYGSSGNGSIEHVAGEMFKQLAGVRMVHIPYRGAAPAITDVMGGQVQLMFATVPTAIANLKTGKLRPLAVLTRERLAALPDVPTAREAGYPGFEVASTYAILAPAGTPPAVLQKLNHEIAKLQQAPDVRARFQTLGIETLGATPEETSQRVGQEIAKWGKAIKDNGIKAE